MYLLQGLCEKKKSVKQDFSDKIQISFRARVPKSAFHLNQKEARRLNKCSEQSKLKYCHSIDLVNLVV